MSVCSAPRQALAAHGSVKHLLCLAFPMLCSVLLALARGSVLAVMPLLPGNSTCTAAQAAAEAAAAIAEACSIHHAQHQFTALAWFAQLRPARSISSARNSPSPSQQQQQYQQPGASPHQQQAQQGAAHSSQQQQQVHSSQQQWQQQPRCSSEAAEALLEPAVLLSGTADGHLQIHSAEGQLLFQQRFAATPVLDILVRPHCSGEVWPWIGGFVTVYAYMLACSSSSSRGSSRHQCGALCSCSNSVQAVMAVVQQDASSISLPYCFFCAARCCQCRAVQQRC